MKTKLKIWVDEAGRGPWFGPVVAASFSLNPNFSPWKNFLKSLTDSKKLTEKQREKIFEEIIHFSLEGKVFFWVWVVDNQYIDKHNIRQATKEAMRRSIVEVLRKIWIGKNQESKKLEIESVVIDGKDNFTFEELKKKPIYIVEGDLKVLEISWASIIAKVFRDRLIKTYSTLYPNLGLEKHKGYGTKLHSEHLKQPSDITWFHRDSYKPIKEILFSKPKLLLHVCCWPDATIPIVDLKKEYEVVAFWYDPNIQPKKEYDKRLKAFIKVCKIEDIEWIEGEYDVKNFFSRIKWLEDTPERWEKCTECYDMRLDRTSQLAQELWISYWTSTLNTSPHKDLEKMFELWDKHSLEKNLQFLKIAFRKNNGFLRSVEYTKKHKIYRQDYCGCVYSDTFPGSPKREKIMKKGGYSGG